ncbi:MAG: alpha/beta hydrolase [Deltaproteobacteria bacterium]|nr:alpha/beta hydrolase [Deltaproteobacteria bacterium]
MNAVVTADGVELTYRVAGAAAPRAPMLTVHGLVSTTHHWKYFTPHFAAERQVISWDYRGHGGQKLEAFDVGVGQFADDAHAVWRAAAGERPAIVVGLSFGVQVALEMWRRHREAVRALVLICGTAGHPMDHILGAGARRAIAGALRGLGRRRRLAGGLLAAARSSVGIRVARELAFVTGGAHRESCPPDVLDGLFAHAGTLPPALVGNVTAAYLEHSAFDVLPTITVPTLIIAGDRDRLTPVATSERMHRDIRDSELVVFPGHTHLVQVETPGAVHAAIEAFLAERGLA